MSKRRCPGLMSVLVALACVAAACSAAAQVGDGGTASGDAGNDRRDRTDAVEPFRFELTPYVAHRMGGRFEEADGDREFEIEDSGASGIILNIAAGPMAQWEVLYARQDTAVRTQAVVSDEPTLDLDVEYFHFGGVYAFDEDGARPFVVMTVGLSEFDPNPADYRSEDFFSVSFGGGVQLRADRRLGVRIEGRVFTTWVDSDSDIFCRSGGTTNVCRVRIDGTTLTQWEARAGLVFRF